MLIRNIKLYVKEEDPILKDLYISPDGIKQALNSGDYRHLNPAQIIDAATLKDELFLLPGFLDAHVHGQGGFDFSDAWRQNQGKTNTDHIANITAALGKTGLSYAMATVVSLDLDKLKKSLQVINQYVLQEKNHPTKGSTKIVGVHLEGPFIDKQCKGAHDESVLQNKISLELFRDIISVAPDISEWKITLHPEIHGAIAFIKQVKALSNENFSVKVFIGHTNASEASIEQAFEAGADGITHLGNACNERCARKQNSLTLNDAESHLVKWALNYAKKYSAGIELIVDGEHLSESFVNLINNTLKDKLVLITDALGPSGLPDGKYPLGSFIIYKKGYRFYLADETGTIMMKPGILPDGQQALVPILAGSAASLPFCVEKYIEWTCSAKNITERLAAIYTTAIQNPRNTALSPHAINHLPDEKNFVLINSKGKVVMSLCNGKFTQHAQQEKQ